MPRPILPRLLLTTALSVIIFVMNRYCTYVVNVAIFLEFMRSVVEGKI